MTLAKFASLVALAGVALLSAATVKADVVFDNMSNYESGNTNSHATATGSTPQHFYG